MQSSSPLEVLKRRFGYDAFRPLQEEIVANTLARRDSLVLMPTGGGKSICYQLPALLLDGVTLVVSPLIALMKDQADALNANGIPARFLNSSLRPQEMAEVQAQLGKGQVKLLYVAPERLAMEGFRRYLQRLHISLIAIDEAHCISEWGHEFRPDYRNLRQLRQEFPSVPVIALTATATKRVREDIMAQLAMRRASVFQSSFNRKNLNYSVLLKGNAFGQLLSLLRHRRDQSAIIYCFKKQETENLAASLNAQGLVARPYHGGMDADTRRRTQEDFIHDRVPIIVATMAFGMGIDKPDIRLVAHHTLPKSLEAYYQETGRAGRDGLPSDCVLFFSEDDKETYDYFIDQMEDAAEQRNDRRKLAAMAGFARLRACRRRFLLGYFGEPFENENCGACDNCLRRRARVSSQRPERKAAVRKAVVPRPRVSWQNLEYDRGLFEELKALRRDLARGKPAFVVFGDVSLRYMAADLPLTMVEFARIPGVGKRKLEEYGPEFLEVIRSYSEAHGLRRHSPRSS